MNNEYLIRIVLRARDEIAGTLAKARAEMAAFRGETNSLKADMDGLNNTITSLNRRLGNTVQRINAVGDAMGKFHRSTSSAQVAMGRMDSTAASLNRELGVTARGTERAGSSANVASGRFGRLAQRMGELDDRFRTSSMSVARLDNSLRGMIVLAAIVFAQQLISVLNALVGSLISVASSAAAAGGALASGLTAGAAQAIPVLGVLAASVARVAAVFEALKKARDVEEQTAVRQMGTQKRSKDATDAVANAQDALVTAQNRVADSSRNIQEAQERLSEARREAKRELQDLIASEREAELRARGAALSQRDAQKALREAIQSGSVSDIERLQLGVDEASTGGTTAQRNLSRARMDASRAAAGGIEGMPSVREAKKALDEAKRSADDASRSVVKAQRGVDKAARGATVAAADMFAAKGQLDYMLANMTEAERGLYRALERLKNTFETNTRPITDIMVRAFTRGVDRANEILSDSRVLGGLTRLTTAMATSFDRIIGEILDEEGVQHLLGFIDEATKNMVPLTDAFIAFGEFFLNLGTAGAPIFEMLVGWIRDLAVWLKEGSDNTQALDDRMSTFGDHLTGWKNLLVAIAQLFGALFGASEESGLRTINDLTAQIEKGTQWIRDNRADVKGWFDDARVATYAIAGFIFQLGKAFVTAFDPEHVSDFTNILEKILLPALVNAIEAMGVMVGIISDLVDNEFIGGVIRLAIEWTLIVKAVSAVFGVGVRIGAAWTHFFAGASKAAAAFASIPRAIAAATGALRILIAGGGLAAMAAAFRGGMGRGRGGVASNVAGYGGMLTGMDVIGDIDDETAKRGRRNGMPKTLDMMKGVGKKLGWIGLGITAADALFTAFTTDGSIGDKASAAGESLAESVTFGFYKSASEREQEWMRDLDEKKKAIDDAVARGDYALATRLRRELAASGREFVEFGKDEVGKAYAEVAKEAQQGIRTVRRQVAGEMMGLKLSNQVVEDGKVTDAEIAKIARKLGKLPPEGKKAGMNTMLEMFKSFEVHGQLPRGSADELEKDVTKTWGRMERRAGRRVMNMLRDVTTGFSGMSGVVGAAMTIMGGNLNETLRELGLKKLTFNIKKPEQSAASLGALAGSVGKFFGGGEATGGFIGNPGERGDDGGLYSLGRGEAVANWQHQKYLEPAVQSFYGHSFADTFKRVRGGHGREIRGGFARGGIVPIPGQPGESIHSSILKDVLRLVNRYKLKITDGFAPTGHAAGGEHPKGLAIDAIPDFARGGSWGLVSKLAKWAEPTQNSPRSPFRWVGYNGDANHGEGDHIHLSWGGGGAMGALGAVMDGIRRMRIRGGDSALHKGAQGFTDKARRGMNKFLESQQGGFLGDITGAKGGMGLSAVQRVINQAMRLVGVPEGMRPNWRSMAVRRANQESGFDPDIVNDWDSNAAAGDPSVGLFQTIGATFRAYALPGMKSITNPLHNAVAAFRYMLERYGSGNWQRALTAMLGREGIGYRFGGRVGSGFGGGDRINALLEEGEHVWTKEEVSAAGGHNVMKKLRAMFGGGGQGVDGRFAPGGEVFAPSYSRNIQRIRGTEFEEIRDAFDEMVRNLKKTKVVGGLLNSIENLVGEGGILDDIRVQVEERAGDRLRRAAKRRYTRGAGNIISDRFDDDPGGLIQSELDLAEADERDLRVEQGDLQDTAASLASRGASAKSSVQAAQRNLRNVKRAKDSTKKQREKAAARLKAARARRQKITAARNNVRERLETNRDSLNESISRQYELQQQMEAQVFTDINDRYDTALGQNENQSRMAEILGQNTRGFQEQRVGLLQNQRRELEGALARSAANPQAKAEIQKQIDGLQVSITEGLANIFSYNIDQVNQEAERASRRRDRAGRLAATVDRLGMFAQRDLLSAQGAILGQETSDLTAQRNGLMALLGSAPSQERRNELQEQIDELNVKLEENSEAIAANTDAQAQATLDAITSRQGFSGGVSSGLLGIVRAVGGITGTVDQGLLSSITAGAGAQLGQTGTDLRAQLSQQFGINLGNASGLEFVNAIRNIDMAGLMANMEPEDAARFQSLINAIIENEAAVQQNTQELAEINGTMSQPQSFSSTAWTTFRQAIFNGMGGLLPQYASGIPMMDTGGLITSTGLLVGHKGEYITPAGVNRSVSTNAQQQNIHVEVHEAEPGGDYTYLANRIAFSRLTPTT